MKKSDWALIIFVAAVLIALFVVTLYTHSKVAGLT